MTNSVLSWKDYFVNLTKQIAKKSKDPSTQVGAIIVNNEQRIISTGYNGFPRDCNEEYLNFTRPLKYNTIIHAEMNALLSAKEDIKNCTLFVTHSPCVNCLKHFMAKGINVIYYMNYSLIKNNKHNEQKIAIKKLMDSYKPFFICQNITNNKTYLEELNEHSTKE